MAIVLHVTIILLVMLLTLCHFRLVPEVITKTTPCESCAKFSKSVLQTKKKSFVRKGYMKNVKRFSKENMLKLHGNKEIVMSSFSGKTDERDMMSYPDNCCLKKLSAMYDNKEEGKMLQYKVHVPLKDGDKVNSWFHNETKDVAESVCEEFKRDDEMSLKVDDLWVASIDPRINSNPWVFRTHFDCYDNYAIMLAGKEKNVLLFNNPIRTVKKTREFLSELVACDMMGMTNVLAEKEVEFEIECIKPGDLLFIPAGMWHYVEAGEGDPSVLLNVAFGGDEEMSRFFDRVWFRQALNSKFRMQMDYTPVETV